MVYYRLRQYVIGYQSKTKTISVNKECDFDWFDVLENKIIRSMFLPSASYHKIFQSDLCLKSFGFAKPTSDKQGLLWLSSLIVFVLHHSPCCTKYIAFNIIGNDNRSEIRCLTKFHLHFDGNWTTASVYHTIQFNLQS